MGGGAGTGDSRSPPSALSEASLLAAAVCSLFASADGAVGSTADSEAESMLGGADSSAEVEEATESVAESAGASLAEAAVEEESASAEGDWSAEALEGVTSLLVLAASLDGTLAGAGLDTAAGAAAA